MKKNQSQTKSDNKSRNQSKTSSSKKEGTSDTGTRMRSGGEGHGQELYAKVKQRKGELERALQAEIDKLPEGAEYVDKTGIAASLSVVNDLLTGDNSDIREPVASNLNRWLESSRHLALAPIPEERGKLTSTPTGGKRR